MDAIYTPDIMELADVLPQASRTKLERLVADRDDAVAAMHAASDRAFEAGQAYQRLDIEVRRKIDELRYSSRGEGREEAIARISAPLKPKEADVKRLEAARDRAVVRWETFAFLDDARDWLVDQRRRQVRFRHHPVTAPKVKDAVAAVEKLRAEIEALDDEWHKVEYAPAPTDDLRSRMVTAVDQIAAQGAPRIHAAARQGDPAGIALKVSPPVRVGEFTNATAGDYGAHFFVWLLRDEIVERVGKLIDAAPQRGVLTDAERVSRFEEIAAKRLELERQEEAVISAAEAAGQHIARRRDADPRAVLEISEIA